MKTVAAALAAFGLVVAAPSFATEKPRETVSVGVSAHGLDLSRAEHREKLRLRMARAIAQACNPGDRIGADLAPDWQCRREMTASAEPALRRLATSN